MATSIRTLDLLGINNEALQEDKIMAMSYDSSRQVPFCFLKNLLSACGDQEISDDIDFSFLNSYLIGEMVQGKYCFLQEIKITHQAFQGFPYLSLRLLHLLNANENGCHIIQFSLISLEPAEEEQVPALSGTDLIIATLSAQKGCDQMIKAVRSVCNICLYLTNNQIQRIIIKNNFASKPS